MASTVTRAAPAERATATAPAWRTARSSRAAARDAAIARTGAVPQALRLLTLVVWGVAVVWAAQERLLRAYGDAMAHELIARRVLDSTAPGISQLGTVWLPLPPLLLTPLVWLDPLWRSGLAGALLGGVLLQLAVGALYRTGHLIGGAAMGWVAALVFLANPNIAYLYTTPLVEMVALSFTCLSIAAAARVLDGLHRGAVPPEALFAASIFVAAGMLSRYDNWMTGLLIGAVFLIATAWRVRDRQAVLAVAICYALVPGVAVALWLGYNWAIFGNPLSFLNGEYSSARIVADLAARGIIPTINGVPPEQGNAARALRTYLTAAQENVGSVPLLLGVVGSIVAIVRRRAEPLALLYPVLLAPVLFYVVALMGGQSLIVTRAAQPDGLFNVRYGISMAPFVALGAAALTLVPLPGRIARTGAIAVVIALALAAGAGQLFEPRGPVTVAEGRLQDGALNARASHAAARWFAQQPRDGLTLMDDALQPQSKIIYEEGGRSLRDFVDSSTPQRWVQARANPPPEITTIITLGAASREAPNDRVGGALARDGAIPGFARAFDNGEIVIFRRIAGGDA